MEFTCLQLHQLSYLSIFEFLLGAVNVEQGFHLDVQLPPVPVSNLRIFLHVLLYTADGQMLNLEVR